MIVVGLLSSKQEALEIQYITRILIIENKIHELVKRQKMIEKALVEGNENCE